MNVANVSPFTSTTVESVSETACKLLVTYSGFPNNIRVDVSGSANVSPSDYTPNSSNGTVTFDVTNLDKTNTYECDVIAETIGNSSTEEFGLAFDDGEWEKSAL